MGTFCGKQMPPPPPALSLFETKIGNAAFRYAGHIGGGMELTRILLSFDKIQQGCVHLRDEFKLIDVNNDKHISLDELKTTDKLSNVSKEQVEMFFHEADMDMNNTVEFNEFVVFYAFCFFLSSNREKDVCLSPKSMQKQNDKRMSEEIAASEEVASGKITAEEFTRRMNRLRSTTAMSNRKGREADVGKMRLRKMFEIIACAWRLFDENNDGAITMTEMQRRLHEGLSHKGKKTPSQHAHAGFFDVKRFQEMDTNKNGSVTFPEFLCAFVRWAYEEDGEEGVVSPVQVVAKTPLPSPKGKEEKTEEKESES